MWKNFSIIFLVISLFFFNINVSALTGNVSVKQENITLKLGDESSFTIIVNNAAGRIDFELDNDNIILLSAENKIWVDSERGYTKNYVISFKSVKVGNTKIKIKSTDVSDYGDLTSFITDSSIINIAIVNNNEKPITSNELTIPVEPPKPQKLDLSNTKDSKKTLDSNIITNIVFTFIIGLVVTIITFMVKKIIIERDSFKG